MLALPSQTHNKQSEDEDCPSRQPHGRRKNYHDELADQAHVLPRTDCGNSIQTIQDDNREAPFFDKVTFSRAYLVNNKATRAVPGQLLERQREATTRDFILWTTVSARLYVGT